MRHEAQLQPNPQVRRMMECRTNLILRIEREAVVDQKAWLQAHLNKVDGILALWQKQEEAESAIPPLWN